MDRARRFVLVMMAGVFAFSVVNLVKAQQFPESMYQEMRWRMIGPFRGGRTRAAAGVPSQPNVFYVGQVNGGVWKSDDYGRSWNPIFDHEPSQSIGAIAVAPSDPNVIYVTSGEGLHRPDLSVGDGIYKSSDAGKTWTHLGLRDGQQIPALVVDPLNSDRVFAAVLGHPYGPNEERGIFRSLDGGQSWQKVLYKDENTGGSAVELDPSNPEVVYASLWQARLGPTEDNNSYGGPGGGLFKSVDGGVTWRPLVKGLPPGLLQINVAIAPSQPSRIYATLATTERGQEGLGVYRSDDAGENWYRVTTDTRPALRIGGGDLPVPRVDPADPDVVYSTSIVTMKSTDGGKTWASFRGAPGGDDYQNIWINPGNPKIILLVSDQGAIVSVNGGETWSSWYNQPTAQLYHVGVSNSFPYRVCAGQQESGSVCISSRGNDGEITFRDWHPVGAIEYGYVTPDPLNPDIVYGAGRNVVTRFHWDTGQVENITPIPLRADYRVDRTQPIMFSPVDPHVMYYTASVLFKTTDAGSSWQIISPDLSRPSPEMPRTLGNLAALDPPASERRGVIYSLAPSFENADTLWAGTDDGLIWNTRDGGKNWKNITPPDLVPWSKVTQLTASHFDEESAYASVSRFRIDDLRPYIYRTHDGGKTWQLIIQGLPNNAPVDTVREDSVRKGLLFAGTENAVWVSFDDGDHWQSLQLNLPHTSMRDLWIHEDDLIVATHGRSFWILDDITPLRQLSAAVTSSEAYLFNPEVALRVRRSTYSDTPLPPDEPAGENPPNGAIVDFFLGHSASGPVTLEILDAKGQLVRRYSSTDLPEPTLEQMKKQLIPLYWLRMPVILPASPGMHRWVWDLHYPAPVAAKHEYPISAVPHDTPRHPLGPRALPGQYRVRLTANGQSYTAPLSVKMDPRVTTSPAGLAQQFNLQTRLASMMTSSSKALLQARSVHDQLQKLGEKADISVGESIKALETKISAVLGTPESAPPNATLIHLNNDVAALYSASDGADAAPSVAILEATTKTERELQVVIGQWEQLAANAVPAINGQLRGANLPEVRMEMIPEEDATNTQIDVD